MTALKTMTQPETSQEIDGAAVEWAARADRGLSAAEGAALEAWAQADPRRRGALLRTMAVMAHFDGDRLEAAARGVGLPHRLSRRMVMTGGALAASLGVAALVLSGRVGRDRTFTTAKGELRSAPLEDGSRVWLDTDSAVRVHYTPARRTVTLLRGEALFDVAKDASRPFVVTARGLEVRAVGTSFAVSCFAGPGLEVRVREGEVDVQGTAPAAPEATRLIPGCWAVASPAGEVAVNHIGVPAVLRALAWRNGKLDFDRVSLSEAAGAFARYSGDRIVIDDMSLAGRAVSGQFAATDPEGFARAVAGQMRLTVRRDGRDIHLSA